MPKKRNGEIPIPCGWEVCKDFDGKLFYIDHNTKQTTWIDPRDRYTKPQTFADCVGDELPFGWEESFDPVIGVFYTDHINKTNQIEDPRQQWRHQQEEMLQEYLVTANEDLDAKKEIFQLKQQRLQLAQDEFENLNDALAHWKASRTSLNSNSSVGSTKHDPDLLRADVALAKNRVARLKRELEQIRTEMQYKEQGVETLQQITEKMAGEEGPYNYNISEAQAIMEEITKIQKSLNSGERERHELMQSLARLKEDFLLSKLQSESSPSVSLLSLQYERPSTASQTDVSGEYLDTKMRLAEMTRLRFSYDEARKSVQNLKHKLASVEERMIPGQTESDKDRLLLIQEKEQLLRELRGLSKKGRSQEEILEVRRQVQQLEHDLVMAMDTSSRQIAESGTFARLFRKSPFAKFRRSATSSSPSSSCTKARLKLQEEKNKIIDQLSEATRITTYLESQLKSISLSTLSMSSGSSRGSFGSLGSLGSLSASSKGSLSSLSFTDIYGGHSPCNSETNLQDLHRRVEKLLQGHSISPIHEIQGMTSSAEDINIGGPQGYIPIQGMATAEYLPMQGVASSNEEINMAVPHGYTPKLTIGSQQNVRQSPSAESPLSSIPTPPPVSSFDVGPPPSYEEHMSNMQRQRLIPSSKTGSNIDQSNLLSIQQKSQQQGGGRSGMGPVPSLPLSGLESGSEAVSVPPLSPISESSSGVCNTCNLSGGNTRSVSAAVSDESVAGDSGVFEASIKRRGEFDDAFDLGLECAQVQIRLKYEAVEGQLHIGLEKARNLAAIAALPEKSQICLKAALLPNLTASFATQLSKDINSPKFNETFKVAISESKLRAKTLSVSVCSTTERKDAEVLGCAQVSLADFDPKQVTTRWYNVLSFRFMHQESKRSPSKSSSRSSGNTVADRNSADRVAQLLEKSSAKLQQASMNDESQQSSDSGKDGRVRASSLDASLFRGQISAVSTMKEESSDESTIISSQTSTLTRNQGQDDMDQMKFEITPMSSDDSADEEDTEEERDSFVIPDDVDILENYSGAEITESESQFGEGEEEEEEDDFVEDYDADTIKMEDKETNTEGNYKLKNRVGENKRRSHAETMRSRNSCIRRSQTFSPAGGHVNANSYICKLNRSDSDSSMPLYKRAPFQRNTLERRSLRWKKLPGVNSSAATKLRPSPERGSMRTSIDLELDLQASKTKFIHLQDEINRLRDLKKVMEEAKARGESELPSWFTDSEQMQQLLQEADNLLNRPQGSYISRQDQKAERLMRKITKEAHKLRTQEAPDVLSFKEKMAFFTTVNMKVPAIPPEDLDLIGKTPAAKSIKEDEMNKTAAAIAAVAIEEAKQGLKQEVKNK
ncbi:protein KIBRA isoform X3 [Lingula anatina]|uniref:Protein kibra n=1 Tax=Lingula anatina TaxID=7574 RepID=A0A1S3HTQ7_LINAN|nr:protein KIBRA isoform X3 [Lingula anatina]|eukprot:XP_013389422.1 protein KIBRA isoform X3 [Lingula anatina]